MKHFYIDLPSNSSLYYYPDNKPSIFTTRFAKALELGEEWEAGLVEISYPASYPKPIDLQQKKIFVKYEIEKPLKPGQTTPDIEVHNFPINHLNYQEFVKLFVKEFNFWSKVEVGETHISFHLDQKNILSVNIPPRKYNTSQYIYIPGFIAKAFCFPPNPLGIKRSVRLGKSLTGLGLYESLLESALAIAQENTLYERSYMQVFVYLDCIGYENVGDSSAQLLRTFGLYPESY